MIKNAELYFDFNDSFEVIGRLWAGGKLLKSFKAEDRSTVIEKAKTWAFDHGYEITW